MSSAGTTGISKETCDLPLVIFRVNVSLGHREGTPLLSNPVRPFGKDEIPLVSVTCCLFLILLWLQQEVH